MPLPWTPGRQVVHIPNFADRALTVDQLRALRLFFAAPLQDWPFEANRANFRAELYSWTANRLVPDQHVPNYR